MSFNIQVNGIKELQRDFSNGSKIVDINLQKAMDYSTTRVKQNVREEIVNRGITNQGGLQKSVNVYESTPKRGVVGVGEKYGLYVEQGSRPHFPPVAAIERWAQTKLGVRGAGFLIARKIARVGTKAHPFVAPAFSRSKVFIQQQFDTAIKNIVSALSKK